MQYITGVVSVTNGSAVVTGVGTAWLTKAAVGNTFKIKSENALYEIGSVNSDTQITLVSPYVGETKSLVYYIISKDYTPNMKFAEVNIGDSDWPFLLTSQVIRKIDSLFNSLSSSGATGTTVGTAGGATALPATPLGYLTVTINGTDVKIPYYNL